MNTLNVNENDNIVIKKYIDTFSNDIFEKIYMFNYFKNKCATKTKLSNYWEVKLNQFDDMVKKYGDRFFDKFRIEIVRAIIKINEDLDIKITENGLFLMSDINNSKYSQFTCLLYDFINCDIPCKICNNTKIVLGCCIFCVENKNMLNNLKITIPEEIMISDARRLVKICQLKKTYVDNKIFNYHSKLLDLKDLSLKNIPQECKYQIVKYIITITDLKLEHRDMINKLINDGYCNLFGDDAKLYKRNLIANDLTYNVKEYVELLIKRNHLEYSIDYLRMFMFSNKKDFKFGIKKYSINIRFLYNLLKSDIFPFVCQLKSEYFIPNFRRDSKGDLAVDIFIVFNVDGHKVPIFIEFDDFYNLEKLSGGHADPDRRSTDIMKDMYCRIYYISLIRVKYDEDIIEILRNVINNKKFPVYRFYKDYFKNKKILKDPKKQKYRTVKPKDVLIYNYEDIVCFDICPKFVNDYFDGKYGFNRPLLDMYKLVLLTG
jgi:hypothetical protein